MLMTPHPLEPFVTAARLARMRQVLAQRLAWFTVVLDNLFDPHNISAVLRSCDAFGVQNVHVIESVETFKVNREISMRADKWLTLHRWRSFAECRTALKRRRFTLLATSVAADALPLDAAPCDRRVAVVLGNEHRGVSEATRAACDGVVTIPMHGFVESLNVSVAAALVIAGCAGRMRRAGRQVLLSPRERSAVWNTWMRQQVKHPDQVLARLQAGG